MKWLLYYLWLFTIYLKEKNLPVKNEMKLGELNNYKLTED